MVTVAVAITAAQPPDAASVYITVYVPGALELGMIDPDIEEIIKPAGIAL